MRYTQGVSLLIAMVFVGFSHSQSILSDKVDWQVSEPILGIDLDRLPASEHPWIAVKDPSVVRYKDEWHLICTLRKNKEGDGRIRIGYLRFSDWSAAKDSQWTVLNLTLGYHGAPQIFFFEPHKKWYLVYQAEDSKRGLKYGPCYSTNADIAKPEEWSLTQPLYVVPAGEKAGLDFWVICDKKHAYLFFTSLDGKMWRARTAIGSFPNTGWTTPVVALRADIFEASHTYSVLGQNRYLTIVEAQADKRRFFRAFVADSLDGDWSELGKKRQSFISPRNVANQSTSWATSYSHGEFLRSGYDQLLTVDPESTQLLFQGANDTEYQRGSYGQIPWRLGLLKNKASE